MKHNRKHISIHIERTAGTSLLSELGELYGPENVLVYKAGKDKLIRLSDIPISPVSKGVHYIKSFLEGTPLLRFIYRSYLKIVRNSDDILHWIDPGNLPDDFTAIHGHFKADRFDDLIPDPYLTVIMREPLQRMVSQYLHWRRAGGNLGWRVDIPFKENMTFEEYALRDEFRNFQTQSFAGKRLDQFDLVGVTHCFDKFVAHLRGKDTTISKEIADLNGVTDKPKYRQLGITKNLVKKFKRYNTLDYRNYHIAHKLASANKAKHKTGGKQVKTLGAIHP